MKKIRICFPSGVSSGVSFFRLYQPMLFLQKFYPEQFEFVTADEENIMTAIASADIFWTISYRFTGHKRIIEFIRKNLPHIKIVVDYDDATADKVPPSVPMYAMTGIEEVTYTSKHSNYKKEWKDKVSKEELWGQDWLFDIEKNKLHREAEAYCIKEADLVTVTTDRLAKLMTDAGAKKVMVLSNAIEQSIYEKIVDPDKKENEVRVCWMMAHSHVADYLEMYPEIDQVISEFGDNVKFYLFTTSVVADHNIHPNKLKVIRGVNIENGYHNLFRNIDIDIGICHVNDTEEFNLYKSPLKALEYTAVGASVLATEFFYGDFLHNGFNALLYKDKQEFRRKLRWLINEKLIREDLRTNAQEFLDKNSTQTIIPMYAKMFEEVMECPKTV